MSRNAPVCKLLAVVNAFLYNYCNLLTKEKMQFMPKPYQLEYLLGTTAFINNAVTPVNKNNEALA